MKLTAAIVGAGRQGLCAAYDFSKIPGIGKIILIDADAARLAWAAGRLEALSSGAAGESPEIVIRTADVNDPGALAGALAGAQAALSAVPYKYGPAVCAAAVEAGAHAADLGGNYDSSQTIRALGARAAERRVAVAADCGLMPGLGNTAAGWAISQLERGGARAVDVEIRCGGIPQNPSNALCYELVFSFDGLINEYDGESIILEGGAIARARTLADVAQWLHPTLGRLEAATTSGGTSTAPESFAGRARTYCYKTIRYPGHFAFFNTLKELGLFREEHRGRLRALLEPILLTNNPRDLVILRVDATAESGESVSREWIDRRDEATGFTAMERMTAFPAVAILELALEGRLRAGEVRVERDVPFDDYFERLERRGIAPRRA